MRASRSGVRGSKPASRTRRSNPSRHLEEDEEVAPKIAEARAMKAQPRSDAGYVRHLFDQFSADYDERMIGQLGYRGAADPARAVRSRHAGTRQACRSRSRLRHGSDRRRVSRRGRAARRHRSQPGDGGKGARPQPLRQRLLSVTSRSALDGTTPYDLLLAADTLVYLGDLEPVFAGARRQFARSWILSCSPSKANRVKVSSWDQSADGAIPRYICGNRPLKPVSTSRVSWRRRHAMRQISLWRALPSLCHRVPSNEYRV